MRKIYSIFLATTAAMLFAPAVNAQLPYPDKGAYSIANTIYDKRPGSISWTARR